MLWSCGTSTHLFIFQLVKPTQIIWITAVGVTHFDVHSPPNVIATSFPWKWHQRHVSLYQDSVRRCCTTPQGDNLTGEPENSQRCSKTRFYSASLGPVDLNLIKSGPIPVTAHKPYEIVAQPRPGAGNWKIINKPSPGSAHEPNIFVMLRRVVPRVTVLLILCRIVGLYSKCSKSSLFS